MKTRLQCIHIKNVIERPGVKLNAQEQRLRNVRSTYSMCARARVCVLAHHIHWDFFSAFWRLTVALLCLVFHMASVDHPCRHNACRNRTFFITSRNPMGHL